jgi:citrate lyase subunit beta/citryl-CoA lyase
LLLMERVFRSVLFVPGVRPDRFAAAVGSGADAVVFDLEDSVEASRKAEARQHIAETLPRLGAAGIVERLVRINAASSEWFFDDLAFVRSLAGIDGVVVPKVELPEQIAGVASSVGGPHVVPLIETARGILHAPAIAAAVGGVRVILFGAEDLTAEIGVPRTVDGDELVYPRSQVVLAATSVGADAVDAVFIDLASPELLRKDAMRARAMGFRGKMAIHPDQIPTINDVFTASPEEVERARRIVEAFDAATRRGEGVVRVDDKMVDAPVATRARRVLATARGPGALDSSR